MKLKEGYELVTGVVCRGYITRFLKETEWNDELVALPENSDLIDGDAIPYYLKGEDGKFHEYYGYKAPEGMRAYISLENFDEDNFK